MVGIAPLWVAMVGDGWRAVGSDEVVVMQIAMQMVVPVMLYFRKLSQWRVLTSYLGAHQMQEPFYLAAHRGFESQPGL